MVKGNRHASYEKKVAEFISTNGPKFKLVQVVHVQGKGVNCQCCGYPDIVNHYHVVGDAKGERFLIGSECQELVLGYAEAHLPASKVRNLTRMELKVLGLKYGLSVTFMNQLNATELAAEVITARRRMANVAGWLERRRQNKNQTVI